VVIYPHLDVDDLRRRLSDEPPRRRRLVITDSMFSMDGDRAPLADLRALTLEHDALLAVDDAHAVGVLGDRGVGLAAACSPDLRMGTLGKALGGFGAFVAASRPIIELLVNRARSFVFTTALPVPVVAAARAAIEWLDSPEGRERRALLASRTECFHAGLQARKLPAPRSPSHIVPLRVTDGDPRHAMEASEALLARGIYAQGIRPPTVPAGTARLRFALMATHTDAHLERALDALDALRSHFS
jgi:glycine C-acetyltransferase